MKQYRTEIVINRPPEAVWAALTDIDSYPDWNPLVGWLKGKMSEGRQISMFIKPLNQSFKATLTKVTVNQELTWVGVQFASWIVSGEHYYKLEPTGQNATRLVHGEYFRGIASVFISNATLTKMRCAFEDHNNILKQRLENA